MWPKNRSLLSVTIYESGPNFAVGYVSDVWNFKNLVDGPHCMIANHKLGYRMEYISGSSKVPREPR